MRNDMLRLYVITTPEQQSKTHGVISEMEKLSLRLIEEICVDHNISFQLLPIKTLLTDRTLQGSAILFDDRVDTLVYSQYLDTSLHIDARSIEPILSDKYRIYKIVSKFKQIHQPNTGAIRNHRDIDTTLAKINSKMVVLKPRFSSYESRNVLLINRARLQQPDALERFNFTDYIMQEYLPETIWPPHEWRLHYVGQTLCRCIKVIDKNNWGHSFALKNIALTDVPENIKLQGTLLAQALVDKNNYDNFTLDFLETANGEPIFLEANYGMLNSFLVETSTEKQFLEPIFTAIFDHLRTNA